LDSPNKEILYLVAFFIFVGIFFNFLGMHKLNEAEERLQYSEDLVEYQQQMANLNEVKKESRILCFMGNTAIVLGFFILALAIFIRIYNKVESLQQEINNIKHRKNLENSTKNESEKNIHY
jgi:uncharacterized membrane protein